MKNVDLNSRQTLIDRVFHECVYQPLDGYSDSQLEQKRPLGLNHLEISELIDGGTADFNKSLRYNNKQYEPRELVLLYCWAYLKHHCKKLDYAFGRQNNHLSSPAYPKIVIDIGCGPGTVALSFAKHQNRTPFKYFGIDRSWAMISQAQSVMDSGKRHGLFSPDFDPCFEDSWNHSPWLEFQPESDVLLVFSYFFASPFLGERTLSELGDYIEYLSNLNNVKSLVSLFVNPYGPPVGAENYDAVISRTDVSEDEHHIFEKTRFDYISLKPNCYRYSWDPPRSIPESPLGFLYDDTSDDDVPF